MPFKSDKQRKACFATKGFNGKINCREWANEGKMKYRGNKMQMGGQPKQSDYPDYESWNMAMEEWVNSLSSTPAAPPAVENPGNPGVWRGTDEFADMFNAGLNKDNPTYNAESASNWENPNKPDMGPLDPSGEEKKRKKIDPYFALRGVTTGLSWLSGKVERNRQNAYQRNQFSSLGQLDPLPVSNFQPTAYNLYAKYGGKISKYQKGGVYKGMSIVDYLNSTGQSFDKESRKALAAKHGIQNYDFSAEKNIELLSKLRGQSEAPKERFKIGMDNRPVVPQQEWMVGAQNTPGTSAIIKSGPRGFSNHPNNYRKTNPRQEDLESGVVVDKRTGRGFIIKEGKVKREFPTITGYNVEGNSNRSQPKTEAELDVLPTDQRATPTGYYRMRPINHKSYGTDIMMLDPFAAFDSAKPEANQVALHRTYDSKNRNKLYGSKAPWGSYGCVNCKTEDVRDIRNEFPKGDTLKVLDSKNLRDRQFINKLITRK